MCPRLGRRCWWGCCWPCRNQHVVRAFPLRLDLGLPLDQGHELFHDCPPCAVCAVCPLLFVSSGEAEEGGVKGWTPIFLRVMVHANLVGSRHVRGQRDGLPPLRGRGGGGGLLLVGRRRSEEGRWLPTRGLGCHGVARGSRLRASLYGAEGRSRGVANLRGGEKGRRIRREQGEGSVDLAELVGDAVRDDVADLVRGECGDSPQFLENEKLLFGRQEIRVGCGWLRRWLTYGPQRLPKACRLLAVFFVVVCPHFDDLVVKIAMVRNLRTVNRSRKARGSHLLDFLFEGGRPGVVGRPLPPLPHRHPDAQSMV